MSEEKNNQEEVVEEETQEEEKEEKKEEEKKQDGAEGINAIAILSYLGILVLVPLLAAKEDEFAQYHAKQGLVLLIVAVIGMFVGAVPIIGWLLIPFISLGTIILAIMGIINVLKKEKKELPVVGKYAKQFKI